MTILNNISKKNMILISLFVISLITVSLYQTLATDITMNKTNVASVDLSYTFDITDQTGRVVKVKAGQTKVLDIFVTNTNNGTIKYGIAYTPSSVKTNDVTIAELSTSKDSVSGLINKNEKKQITIIIINNKTSDISLTLVPVTGYEHGGNLIVPSNHTLITEEYELFDPVNAVEYVESLLPSNPETMNNDDPDGNVRYMGADPNNYVSFNDELWRIIGVFDVASTNGGTTEKRLKIIRDESIGSYSWDNKPSGTGSSTSNYGSNDWTDSTLMEVLNNGAYWNRTSGTCPSGSNGATTSCNFSSTGLTEEAKNLIGDAVWNLGGTASYTSASTGLASHFYGYERGTTVYSGRPTYWIGKIGLMYPSDYGYATSGGTTTNRASCLAKEMYNWVSSSYSDCKNNDYLYNSSSTQWTMTPRSSSSNYVFYVNNNARLNYNIAYFGYAVLPTAYLKSSVLITGGDGTSENPYKLQGPPTGAEYIESLLTSNSETMNNDDPDGNVRYMGAAPNNYVSFNDELWRIIGVFDVASTNGGPTEKRLKIIRDESIGSYAWDNKPSGTGSSNSIYGGNDWTDSVLMEVLNNGAYWNRTSGTCPSGSNGATTSCNFSSTGLTEEAKNLIGDAVWNLGGTASYTSASTGLASHFYGYERGTTVYSGRPTYWIGKIGLMYPSDYGYATSGGTTTNRASCLAKEMSNWHNSSYSDCKSNDYLYNSSSTQWTMTPSSSNSSGVIYVSSSAYLYRGNAYIVYAVLPTAYLKSSVSITSGDGSQDNPYVLST